MKISGVVSFVYAAFLIQIFQVAWGQDTVALRYAKTITENDLRDHLTIIASDAMEGRDTGAPGQKMAASYIEYEFKSNSLDPIVRHRGASSYFQKFYLSKDYPGEIWLEANGNRWLNHKEIYYEGNENMSDVQDLTAVFVGAIGDSTIEELQLKGKAAVGLTGSAQMAGMIQQHAYEAGASAVIIIWDTKQDQFDKKKTRHEQISSNPRMEFQNIDTDARTGRYMVPIAIGEKLFDTSIEKLRKASEKAKMGKMNSLSKIKPVNIRAKRTQREVIIDSENVLGLVEGSDNRDEVIVITAHYDHVGRNESRDL